MTSTPWLAASNTRSKEAPIVSVRIIVPDMNATPSTTAVDGQHEADELGSDVAQWRGAGPRVA